MLSLTLLVITTFMVEVSFADKDAFKTMEEICQGNGFLTESYTLTTSDGYILSLYRIPGLVTDKKDVKKPAVLFMHCQDCDMM